MTDEELRRTATKLRDEAERRSMPYLFDACNRVLMLLGEETTNAGGFEGFGSRSDSLPGYDANGSPTEEWA